MNDAVKQQVTELLRVNSMTADTLNLRTLMNLFLAQMRISLYGGKASVAMLPTFLRPFGSLTEREPVVVAEITGKEIRVCLVSFAQGKPTITGADSFPVPGREYPAPFSDLIYAVAELLAPLTGQAERVALCLPFPVDFDGTGDGVIRSFPGSMSVSDYEGKPILADLTRELESRGISGKRLTLVSRPDAVLLAAGVSRPGMSRYLGLTWGSGVDVGFAAPGSIVLRWQGIPGGLMLFDGGFSSAECVPFGLADFGKDRDSYAPGRDLYLKMVSTEYLGDLFRIVMLQAAEKKLLTFSCSRNILSLTKLALPPVLEFLQAPQGDSMLARFCREPEDNEVAVAVGAAVLDRAARLVCANLAAVMMFTGGGRDPAKPVCVGLSGDALPSLGQRLETHLYQFAAAELGFSFILQRGEDMPAIGSAAAALYN